MISDIFILFIIFGTVFGVFYLFFTTRHKERMAIIEKGVDFQPINTKNKMVWKRFSLSAGIVLLSMGIGLLIALFLSVLGISVAETPLVILCVIITTGIGLIVNFFVLRRIDKDVEADKPS